MTKVAVFIDHSNVTRRIIEIRQADPSWARWYDPLKLATKLVGANRSLVKVYFFYTPPPTHLAGLGWRQKIYHKQTCYYDAISKLSNLIEMRQGRVAGGKYDLHEKNLDTQLSSALLVLAAQDVFDTAIIVANDGDYASAVDGAKELEKKVELVYFKGKKSWQLDNITTLSRRARKIHFEPLTFTITP